MIPEGFSQGDKKAYLSWKGLTKFLIRAEVLQSQSFKVKNLLR
jgi:hypothetical protein